MFCRTAGFDIGSSAVHIALRSKNGIESFVSEPLPESLAGQGKVCFGREMADFLSGICKKHGSRFGTASVLLPQRECICCRLDLPPMTDAQLRVNIPYELRDFTGGGVGCIYDYSVIKSSENGLGVMAAAAQRQAVNAVKETFRRAGIRLKEVIPPEEAYARLPGNRGGRICIADLGGSAVRLYIYSDGCYEMTHTVDFGCLEAARAYSSGESPQACEKLCYELAENIRNPVYFFGFSRPEAVPERIYLIGGGAFIPPLVEALKMVLPVRVASARELFDAEGAESCLGAVGAALQRSDDNGKE